MRNASLPAYLVDTSRWPLVTAAPTAAVRDPDALTATYAALDILLDRRQPFVSLLDLRGGASDPNRRRRFADWLNRNRGRVHELVVAHAVVVGSTIERGFVTAALWLVSTPCPMRIFTSQSDAEDWLLAMYAARNRPSASP